MHRSSAARWFLGPALAGALLLAGGPARAQSGWPTPENLRLDWKARTDRWLKPGIEGTVHNASEYRVANVRLRVEVLNGDNVRVSERLAWVYGAIDADRRSFFVLPPPPPGHSYRISVESFDVVQRQPAVAEGP